MTLAVATLKYSGAQTDSVDLGIPRSPLGDYSPGHPLSAKSKLAVSERPALS